MEILNSLEKKPPSRAKTSCGKVSTTAPMETITGIAIRGWYLACIVLLREPVSVAKIIDVKSAIPEQDR